MLAAQWLTRRRRARADVRLRHVVLEVAGHDYVVSRQSQFEWVANAPWCAAVTGERTDNPVDELDDHLDVDVDGTLQDVCASENERRLRPDDRECDAQQVGELSIHVSAT